MLKMLSNTELPLLKIGKRGKQDNKGPFFNYVRVKGWVGGIALFNKNPYFLLLRGVGTWSIKGQKYPYVIKE